VAKKEIVVFKGKSKMKTLLFLSLTLRGRFGGGLKIINR
jgi:hypothetical protein